MRFRLPAFLLPLLLPGLLVAGEGRLVGGAGLALPLSPVAAGQLKAAFAPSLALEFREDHWPLTLTLSLARAAHPLETAGTVDYRILPLSLGLLWDLPLGLPDWLHLETGLAAGPVFESLGDGSSATRATAFQCALSGRLRFSSGDFGTGLALDWRLVAENDASASFFTASLFVAWQIW